MVEEDNKPNNSEKNTTNSSCLDVKIVKIDKVDTEFTRNLNNLNNLNNINNLNNLNNTSILDTPKNKAEKTFYYLFDNGKSTAEQLVQASGVSSVDSIYVLKNREQDKIVSEKELDIAYYDLTPEFREQIALRISQRQKELLEVGIREDEEETELKTNEDFIISFKNCFRDRTIITTDRGFIWLDLEAFRQINPELCAVFEEKPKEMLEIMDVALEELGLNMPLRYKNISCMSKKTIDSLRSEDLNKLILLEVRSSTVSDVRPQIINAKFECPSCGTVISVLQMEKSFREPSRCSCGRRGGFKEISTELVDRVKVVLEDLQELSEAPNLKSIQCIAFESLTKEIEMPKFNPGNDLRVLGIYDSEKIYLSRGGTSTSLDTYFKILEVEEFEPEINLDSYSEDEKSIYHEISNRIDKEGLGFLVSNIAPAIHGSNDIKTAIIIQAAQSRNQKGKTTRNKSNILMMGDPGSAKSVLLKEAVAITQGSNYISAGSATAVGITGAVEKTKDEGYILKPGVLPKTKELVAIDELNLMDEEERPKLQEGLSEQEITINKASIHTKLRVSCGVIAAANPIRGIFVDGYDPIKQFNLTPQLLNRFDCIFMVEDKINKENDREIAKSMLRREEKKIICEYDSAFLRKYFLFIRSQPEPKFKKELLDSFIPELYSKIRESSNRETKLINPRFVESLTRLSRGVAKLRFSKVVEEKDVEVSFNVLKKTFLNIGDDND